MEETSRFYRHVHRVQMRILVFAGLVAPETGALNPLATSVYVNLAFATVSSVYIYTFVQDCLDARFNPGITSELFSFVGFHLRFVYILSRRDKLGRMLEYVEGLWRGVTSEEKIHVRRFVRKASRLSVCYSGIILTTITLYVLSSQLPQWTAGSSNATVHRVLPYPFYVDVQSSPQYEILLGAQIVCLLTVTQTSICVDMAVAFLIMIACGHFRLIQVRLERVARMIDESQPDELENNAKDIRDHVKNCVAYHCEIIGFCGEIATLSSEIFIVELISTTYNLSLIGILLAGSMPFAEKFKFAPVLFILATQLFVCQYPPDLLLQESAGVADAAYFVPPLRRDRFRIDTLLLALLRRSQIPYQLLAGGQIKLNIESFGNMIRGAVSFFTVLRNFN
ncbi:uncharacterized protein LOC106643823 [Copidosoma floridanum]|uniref:uncharacterized protein LOC106643823 n=1 Tax=Copidosoma floridanum TaxID=29053 RepID=UPI0006C9859C|nr:uncharacterized protein LOC106643823 [Copidosoma floridanum]